MKEEQEITVEVTCNEEKLLEILRDNGYKLNEEVFYNDIYMIKNEYMETVPLKMLEQCIILRKIEKTKETIKEILYKKKYYNDSQEIISQSNISVKVYSLNNAQKFFEQIGYHQLIEISDAIKVYSNNDVQLAVQYVNNKHIYIELENHGQFTSYEEMKNVIKKLNIPIKENEFFAKKAVIEILETSAK